MKFFKMLLLVIVTASLSPAAAQTSNQEVPADLAAKHKAANECDPLENFGQDIGVEIHSLDDQKQLYILPCTSGAYNFSYALYVSGPDIEGYQQLIFADYSEEMGWSGTNTLVNPIYDAQARELTSYHKWRGLGDCGTSGTWRWNGDNFKLLEFRAKDECPEEFIQNVEFPLIYSAKE